MRRAIELEPQRASCMTRLGTVLVQKSDLESAAAGIFRSFSPAAQFCASASASRRAPLSLQVHSRKRKSICELRLELNPASPDGHYYLGQILRGKEQTDAAIRELQACVNLKPDYPDAQSSLGLLLQSKR